MKHEWKIGKGMKNTLPPRIGTFARKRKTIDEDEEFKRKLDRIDQEEQEQNIVVEYEVPHTPRRVNAILPTVIEAKKYDNQKNKMIALGQNCIAQAMLSLTPTYFDIEKAVVLLKDASLYLQTARRME
jgi:hypothetical protein